jgi:hypothetical protein
VPSSPNPHVSFPGIGSVKSSFLILRPSLSICSFENKRAFENETCVF